jgi:enoyl-CoA hydratase/carnithine racemase
MARSPGWWMHRLSNKLVVYVHGSCIGAGVELPAFAARVVATGHTTFRLPELQMGLIPGAGGTASIARRIGRQRAAWLALTGDAIDARLALEWGLLDDVVEVF